MNKLHLQATHSKKMIQAESFAIECPHVAENGKKHKEPLEARGVF